MDSRTSQTCHIPTRRGKSLVVLESVSSHRGSTPEGSQSSQRRKPMNEGVVNNRNIEYIEIDFHPLPQTLDKRGGNSYKNACKAAAAAAAATPTNHP